MRSEACCPQAPPGGPKSGAKWRDLGRFSSICPLVYTPGVDTLRVPWFGRHRRPSLLSRYSPRIPNLLRQARFHSSCVLSHIMITHRFGLCARPPARSLLMCQQAKDSRRETILKKRTETGRMAARSPAGCRSGRDRAASGVPRSMGRDRPAAETTLRTTTSRRRPAPRRAPQRRRRARAPCQPANSPCGTMRLCVVTSRCPRGREKKAQECDIL
jgi:hypothetical protein